MFSGFLQAVKLEKVYLVGHSLGGWIAASYALKYPEKIDGLVLLAPEGVKIARTRRVLPEDTAITELSTTSS